MAITVADILAMPAVRAGQPRVLAGDKALDTHIRWVHSAEIIDVSRLLRGGELILTTGLAFPAGPEGLTSYAASLAAAGAAGLVVEVTQRWTDGLPEALIEECCRRGLPLVELSHEVSFAKITQEVGEQIIDMQLAELRAVEEIHERFIDLSVNGAKPAAVLDEVSRLSSAPVVLASPRHQVLSYVSGPQSAQAVLESFELQSRALSGAARTFFDRGSGWLVTSVEAQGKHWGRLILQTGQEPPYRHIVLAEQAAASLALYLLHARQRDSIERQTHGAILAAFASGDITDELLARCEGIGFPLTRQHLCGLSLRPTMPGNKTDLSFEDSLADIAAITADYARRRSLSALVSVSNDEVRAVIACPTSRQINPLIDELAYQLRARVAAVIGAGSPVSDPLDVQHSLAEAHEAAVATHAGDTGVRRIEDIHVRGLLHLMAGDQKLKLFVHREIGALIKHDAHRQARRSQGLVEAVRALLTYPNSKSHAAASLHLSRPAFYERLAKAERLLKVDLNNGEVRTAVHLALLAHEALSIE